ncbi:heavy-metal-associated domain-containing protein [Flavobacterium sp. ARAG 55.4]|uniref:heavy-metal-associated domain-containing protein n=1 Tax=Flavobacterium sp. ARAG 55.4 TaxID=3451357 RepID=UPI003F448571
MKSLKKIMTATFVLLSMLSINAQIKNKKTANVKIAGNCEMCKKTIETAGNIKKTAMVNWNVDSKIAQITYDSSKTNPEEILKRIADAGYENEEFVANDKQYNKLHSCCQYDRNTIKKEAKK